MLNRPSRTLIVADLIFDFPGSRALDEIPPLHQNQLRIRDDCLPCSTFRFTLAFPPAMTQIEFNKCMGLITDLLKESSLKTEQLENIALVEQRLLEEKLALTKEVERLKAELDRTRTELAQARNLVRMLEQEVGEWRGQARPREAEASYRPEVEAGS